MPVWPFGRKHGRAAKLKEGRAVPEGRRPGAPYAHAHTDSDALRRTPSRRSSRRKRRSSRSTESMRDFDQNSPDRPAAFDKSHSPPRGSAEDITALPLTKRLDVSPHLRPITQDHHHMSYNFQTNSHSSLPTARERGKLQRPQSLRNKRSANDSALVRRKSSKKRKNDHIREEEIRAMSMPLPQKRPAGNSGGMLRRDSKKVKGGLNRHFERPTSNVSLPPEESIHSSMSSGSESRAFRVSALDMFSPRPKIRLSIGSQQYYTGAGSSPPDPSRTNSRKERRATTSKDGKDEWKASKRIDELADTLDAGALREILERDKRRREKKRRAEEERLRRRLERRAEKQRTAEQGGTPATPRKEAKGAVGLGIAKDTSTPMEDIRPSTPRRSEKLDTTGSPSKVEENSQLPTPMDSPVEEPVVADAKAIRYSRASMSPPVSPVHTRGPSNISQMPELLSEIAAKQPVESVERLEGPRTSAPLLPVESTDTTDTRKGSSRRRSSEGKRMGMWSSFFRRGKRNSQDQGRTTPSEVSFSNTSRESMSRQPPPAHLVQPTQPIQIRRPSAVPGRSGSKFREDLPEFPLSPPDSRVQSPEVTSSRAVASRRRSQQPSDIRIDSNSPAPGYRTDSPVSPGVPASGLMSQSLASVDSEGSWLSGKPMKRISNKSHMRSSVGSEATPKPAEDFSASYEELGIPDDEYFQRLTPQPDEKRRSAHSGDVFTRKPSSTAIAAMATTNESDDEEEVPVPERPIDEENLVKGSVGRQPTIVHRQARVKSTEGLLNQFNAEDVSSEPTASPADALESPDQESPASESEPVSLQRATSVDFGKHHVRHLSAGSAKLLDIPAKRSSLDQKRSSSSSRLKAAPEE